jgi:hypothetical protein
MPVKTYEAILASPASIAQVGSARPAIERAGGRVKVAPPTSSGMVLVTLILPDNYTPQDFVPGLPFYLI